MATVVVFNASGTWTPPDGVLTATVECWGTGGTGGANTVNGGGGGGGGAYAKKVVTVAFPTAYTIQVAAGVDSFFSSATEVMAKRGVNGSPGTLTDQGAGGAGGSGATSVGTTKNSGGGGGGGVPGILVGGGGGGSGGDTTAGGAGASLQTAGTAGTTNGAAGGRGGDALTVSTAGSAPGAGGGGEGLFATDVSGAAGAGRVTITFEEAGNARAITTLASNVALVDQGSAQGIATLSALVAIADSQTGSFSLTASALVALADQGLLSVIQSLTANWQRVSPRLSGIAYNATGTTPQSGAQVLIFRDDTNALIATLTSDGAGAWSSDLSPSFTYWVSGHKAGTPQIADRTDRAIPTTDVVVETGT